MKRRGSQLTLALSLVLCIIWFYNCNRKPLFNDPQSTVLFDESGHLLGARIAGDGQWRFPYCKDVPEGFKTCLINFEDKRFYDHIGIDFLAILRAIRLNILSGKKVSGASTISMQVIRLSRKGKPRTYFEKIVELFKAIRLELSYSKEEILQLYSTYAPFGGNIVGLETASWKYFGRSVDKLSMAEYATLAVLPNRPSMINPNKNRNILMKQRNKLLKDLFLKNIIDSVSYSLSLKEPLPKRTKPLPNLAPHLIDFVQYQLEMEGRINLTIQRDKQVLINQLLETHHKYLRENEIHNVSALLLDTKSGKVLAYTGNVGYFKNPLGGSVDMIQSKRSTGSILKPILFAASLDDGLISSSSLLPDVPTYFGDYSPQNYSLKYAGAVSASEALIRSLNVPTVRLLSRYGQPKFYDKLKKLGITTLNKPPSHYGLSLILGGSEVKIWDITGTYASMARSLMFFNSNNSTYNNFSYHSPILFQEDTSYLRIDQSNYSNISAGALFEMFQSMAKVVRPGSDKYWEEFTSSQQIAWKTGTSFGFRDAWAIGCTPKYTLSVWVGNASGEGRPGLTGLKAAAPVLFDIFNSLNREKNWFEKPLDDFQEVNLCKHSGYKSLPDCPNSIRLFTVKGAKKLSPCSFHRNIHIDPFSGKRVSGNCCDPFDMHKKTFFVLPPAQEWYFKKAHPNYETIPPFREGCKEDSDINLMEFIYPVENISIIIPKNLDGSIGEIVFELKHRHSNQTVYWHIDDEYVGETKFVHELSRIMTEGEHLVTAVDADGNRIQQKFSIISNEK